MRWVIMTNLILVLGIMLFFIVIDIIYKKLKEILDCLENIKYILNRKN